MAAQGLEAQLTRLTQEFVHKLVEAIRNASFAEVAALGPPSNGVGAPAQAPRGRKLPAAARPVRAGRQTAAKRAELAERVVGALKDAKQPMGARALSSELGVAPDLLAAPLRELRAAGRIKKHGDKRATTYSLG
ncbi:MAG TPA: hypothetical protein VF765_05100 [Polyangiaceae bacterium]